MDDKIAPDEPRFTLRANDWRAPAHVRRWAEEYLADKSQQDADNVVSVRHVRKYQSALAIADSMEAWQAKHAE